MSSLSFAILLVLTAWPLASSLQHLDLRSDRQADASPPDEDQSEPELNANPDFELLAHTANEHAVGAARNSSWGANRTVVWVNGYARSGTSTVLSMVEAAGDNPPSLFGLTEGKASSNVFALFEPCKSDDKYEPWLTKAGCGEVLRRISMCDFSGILYLKGWNNSHSTKPGLTMNADYTPGKAQQSCLKASIVAFKTINIKLNSPVGQEMLNVPGSFIIDIVRDPRGVYASYKKTFGRKSDLSLLSDMCDFMEDNQGVKNPRIVRLVFEDFVREPMKVMMAAFKTMGLSFKGAQWQWVQDNFNAKKCKPTSDERYADCHVDPEATLLSWRDEISKKESQAFTKYKSCKKLMKQFNYPKY